MIYLILAVVFVPVILFVLGACKVAARADLDSEREFEDKK